MQPSRGSHQHMSGMDGEIGHPRAADRPSSFLTHALGDKAHNTIANTTPVLTKPRANANAVYSC